LLPQRGRPPAKSQKTSSSLASTLGHMGTDGSSAIAAAASQAIMTSKKVTIVIRLTATKLFYFGFLIKRNMYHVMSLTIIRVK